MFRSVASKLFAVGSRCHSSFLKTYQWFEQPSAFHGVFVSNQFSTSCQAHGLMEFFDDQKYWKEGKVKHGREWKLDELRLKSNVDLHKLWFILLKERNMLLTMEEICKKESEVFPSPERLAKVFCIRLQVKRSHF